VKSLLVKLHHWLRGNGKCRVLLVDDEPGILATLGAILELHDLQVVTAPSAAGANKLLQTKHFDLVITDMKMESDTAVYTVIAAARRSPGSPPTLIITGCSGLASNWEEHGATAMLTKPTRVPELLAVVDRLLEHPRPPKASEVRTEAA
jgi:DNA-binding NtrC family response regulator